MARTLPRQTATTVIENLTTFHYRGGLELQVARYGVYPPEGEQAVSGGYHRDGDPMGSAIVYRVAPGLEWRDGQPVRRVIGRASLDREAGHMVLHLADADGGIPVGTLDRKAIAAEVVEAIWQAQPAPRWWERWPARLMGKVA